MEKFISFIGIGVMVLLAWAMSENRKRVDWRTVGAGILLQFIFAALVLLTTPGRVFFDATNSFVTRMIEFSDEGAKMVFGDGFKEHFFAFSVLPTIIFVSSLMAVFFYFGIIQKVVKFFAVIMVKVMKVSGAESLASSANIFVGQTEAPLVIKPYIERMTRSEIMSLMTGGMANVAGGVMAAYVSFGADAGHLLAGSIMSAPASLLLAKIMVPETESPLTLGKVRMEIPIPDSNALDAACRGASEGLQLALNVAAMLIAFVALAALMNYGLSFFPSVAGAPLTFERILGWLFSPIAFVIGVPWQDVSAVGMLLGKKMFLNEFVAYLDLKDLKGVISERSFILSTYALCGFANFASIAIQIGGIGAMVPGRRKHIVDLGVKSMLAGTLSTFMTASVAGLFI